MAAKTRWQVIRHFQAWKPEKVGDSIQGVVVGRKVIETKFGSSPQVELADKKTGEVLALLTGKAGLRVLNRVAIDTLVRVTYLGEKRVPGRKIMMDDFEVAVPLDSKLGADFFLDGGGDYARKEKPAKRKK